MIKVLVNGILHTLFYSSPNMAISKDEEQFFNDLYESALNQSDKVIHYHSSIPKYKFLYYLSLHKGVVFHGSNNKEIISFEPREQTLYNGELAKAVFATNDAIWPFFYATLQKDYIVGDIRNAALITNGKKTFHFYSLTKSTKAKDPWTNGIIYLLPKDSFTYIGKGVIQFNEWISTQPVSPIAKLEVQPKDFYFLNKVGTHNANESVIKSWILYKIRTLIK